MKILIFAELYYPDIMGGGEFSTKQMTEGLAERGHDLIVYCLGKKNCREEIQGVRVKRKYIRGTSEHFLSLAKNNPIPAPFTQLDKIRRKWGDLYPNKRWYRYYRAIIEKEGPDLVHTASPMSYLGRVNLWKAAYDLHIPVSHVCRGPNLLQLNFLGGRLDSYNRHLNAGASAYLTALAAPSRYMLDSHNRAGIRGKAFNEVIYNAVDFDLVPLGEELMEEKENLILYAGELSEKKGISTLIKAVDGLQDVRLLLIGRGRPESRIERTGKVELLDWMEREELYTYMKKAKAVVLPSKWNEPFGRILIEAMGQGTLAIGSDRGAIPEVLDFNRDYIFKSGDAAGLRNRLQRVLRMSSSRYREEVQKQRRTASYYRDATYIDHWQSFFLQQLR
ncbi:MAG: glycosyltransferase [Lachnospiraceae bacterium]|nr:glycosyltransferase [Lachnospiraceae bacterium]